MVIVAVIAGLGFYMGWFHLSTANDDSHANVTVTVDKDQFQKDKNTVEDEVETTVEKIQN
jgi:hypothetical protein